MNCPKNDLVYNLLFEDIILGFDLRAEQLAQHWGVARIDKIGIEIVFNEIEEGQQAGESSSFGLRLSAFGESVHEVQDVFHRQIGKFIITELITEPFQNERIGSNRIFFWN
jgi:hypothetical protein